MEIPMIAYLVVSTIMFLPEFTGSSHVKYAGYAHFP